MRPIRVDDASSLTTYAGFQARYRDDPAGFALDCVNWRPGEHPAPYQLEVLTHLASRRRASVRGPHGLGKTALASLAILWFALTRDGEDWKIPTTASAWRQLTKFLWPEIHKWSNRLRWDRIGRGALDRRAELLTLSMKLATGEAFALASNQAALIEGAHADHLLYLFDEAKTIPPDTWDAAEGAMSSGSTYWLAISTPGEPVGRFYDIHRRRPGYDDWWVRHVTRNEAVAAGRIDEKWAEKRRQQWGENSAVYQNRVEGQFASGDEDGVIPLSWVEAANERWHAISEAGDWGPLLTVGVDVARYGSDRTVLALRHEAGVKALRRHSKEDTMQTAGRVAGVLEAQGGRAVVDVIGVGAGVVDRLREMGRAVDAFNSSERTDKRDVSGELGFADKRAAAYWQLRELLDPAGPAPIALPPDDLLTGDLTAPHWRVQSGGRIRVESKDDIKERLGRSPDDGDAVVMAFWRDAAQPTGGVGFVL